MSLHVWPTRMFLHGTGISAGFVTEKLSFMFFYLYLESLTVLLKLICGEILGCARTSQLFCAETRLMSRIGRWKQSRSHSIERRIFNTMRFLQRATTTLRNLSSIWLESLLGNIQEAISFLNYWWICLGFCFSIYTSGLWLEFHLAATPIFTLLSLLLLLLQKFKLT